jgi:hypothetical protein
VNRPSMYDPAAMWKKYADHLEAELSKLRDTVTLSADRNTELEAERNELRKQGLQLADDLDKCRSELAARILGDKPEGHRTMCASNYRRGDVYPCDCGYDKTLGDKP